MIRVTARTNERMPQSKSILVVEDEADLANMLSYHLTRGGFNCRLAADGQTALAEAQRQPKDGNSCQASSPGSHPGELGWRGAH